MKYIYAIIGTFFFMSIATGQEAIEGQVTDYTNGKAEIVGGIRTPIPIGTINEDGTFIIPLDKSYKDQLIASIETHNESRSDWKTTLPSVERSYGNCTTGSISIEGGDQIMIGIGTFGMFSVANIEEQKLYGKIMFASDQEFAEAFISFGQFKANEGYQLDWLYFEEEASVKGSCSLEFLPNDEEKFNQVSDYDLEFKPGWNLVKYEILEVFTDRDGKQYIQHERSTVIDEVPEDVQICFIR
jgi:hypothetical protein